MKKIVFAIIVLLNLGKEGSAQCTATITGSTCAGGTLTLNTTGGTPTHIEWYLNGQLVSSLDSNYMIGRGLGWQANQLSLIYDDWVDASGNIFVVDKSRGSVQKFIPGAVQGVIVAGGNGSGAAANQLNNPTSIYIDAIGTMYIADQNNHRIQKWLNGASSGITVAGGNGSGSSSNQLSSPNGVYVDGSGNIFIADLNNHRVQEWTPGAILGITVAGGNGLGSAANQLDYPTDVFVNGSGDIFVCDRDNYRIQKWQNGAIAGTTVAGGNGSGTANNQFLKPVSVFLDASNNIYVADYNFHRVQKWASGALQGVTVAGTASGNGNYSYLLDYPTNVFVDAAGNIFVADQGNNRVMKWTVGATAGTFAVEGNGIGRGATNFFGPHDVWVDGSDNVFVADYGNDRIQKWSPGATQGVTVAGGQGYGSAANQLANPYGVCVDQSGNVYVADFYNDRIQMWAPGSTLGITVAGGNGHGGAANQFRYPSDVYVDLNGNIYVADMNNYRIQLWTPGAIQGITVAGGNGIGSDSAHLNVPKGIYVDGSGNIYIGDYYNNRVLRWANGAIYGTTVMWNGPNLSSPVGVWTDATNINYATSNINAIARHGNGSAYETIIHGGSYGVGINQLRDPMGLYLDQNLKTYVADFTNHRIMVYGHNVPLNFSPTVNGVYYAVVTMSNGCSAISQNFTVSSPSISISPNTNQTICSGQNLTLTGTGGTTYLWSNGATTTNINVTTSGTYFVTGTISGCSAVSSSVIVAVTNLPNVTISPNTNQTICAGQSVILTANGATTYLWNNGSTTTSINVNVAGQYYVTGTTSNCSATSPSDTLFVTSLPNVTISPSTPQSLCSNQTITLTASGGTTYLWSNNATTASINVNTAGSYSVTGTTAGCSATSAPVVVTATPCATPTNLSNNQITQHSGKCNWTGGVTCATGYQIYYRRSQYTNWQYVNVASTQSQKVLYNLQNNYNVQWKIRTKCSATSYSVWSAMQTFHTLPRLEGDEPTTATTDELKITAYPNPTDGNVTVQLNIFSDESKVIVTNMLGQIVQEGTYQTGETNGEIQLNISDLPQGIYMVFVLDAEGKRCCKIIKE